MIQFIDRVFEVLLERFRYLAITRQLAGNSALGICLLELLYHALDAMVYDIGNIDSRISDDHLDEIYVQKIIPLTVGIMDDLLSSWTSIAFREGDGNILPQRPQWLLISCHYIVKFWGLVIRSELEYSIIAESLGNSGLYTPLGAVDAVEAGIVSTLREWSFLLPTNAKDQSEFATNDHANHEIKLGNLTFQNTSHPAYLRLVNDARLLLENLRSVLLQSRATRRHFVIQGRQTSRNAGIALALLSANNSSSSSTSFSTSPADRPAPTASTPAPLLAPNLNLIPEVLHAAHRFWSAQSHETIAILAQHTLAADAPPPRRNPVSGVSSTPVREGLRVAEPVPRCAREGCGQPWDTMTGDPLKKCGRCWRVLYCSIGCQIM